GQTRRPARPPADSAAPVQPPKSGSGSGGGSAAPAPAPQAGPCSTVKVDLNLQPDRPGVALLTLTNASQRTCVVKGWVDLRLQLADGNTNGEVRKVNQPGPPTSITLRPWTTAFAGVKWTPCDKADEDCIVGTGFSAAATGSRNHVAA